jgi:hypothetical protein
VFGTNIPVFVRVPTVADVLAEKNVSMLRENRPHLLGDGRPKPIAVMLDRADVECHKLEGESAEGCERGFIDVKGEIVNRGPRRSKE